MQHPIVEADQRRHPREDLHWPVRWRVGNDVLQPGYVCDVSPGGVFIRPTAIGGRFDIQLGQQVELKFKTRIGEEGDTIVCKGHIRWYGQHSKTQRSGFGVAFERPSHLAMLLGAELQTQGWLQEPSRQPELPEYAPTEIDLTDMAEWVSAGS